MEPIKNSKFRPVISNTMKIPGSGQINFFKKALFGHTLASWPEDMCLLSLNEVSGLYHDALKYGFKMARDNPDMKEVQTEVKHNAPPA